MSNHILKTLQLHSDVEGLVEVNGSLAGEVGKQDTILYAQTNRFVIRYMPITKEEEHVYLPFVRIIEMDEKQSFVRADDGVLTLYNLPDEGMFLNLAPDAISIAKPIMPFILTSREYGGYRATVYFDRTYNFLLESLSGQTLFAYSIAPILQDAEVFFHMLKNTLVVLVTGNAPKGKILFGATVSPTRFLCCEPCENYEFMEDSVVLYQAIDKEPSCFLAKRYSIDGTTEAMLASETTVRCSPRILTLALTHDSPDVALSCLAPSLRNSLTFADLKEYFDEFTHMVEPLSSDTKLTLAYQVSNSIYHTRVFDFEFSNGLIANIHER